MYLSAIASILFIAVVGVLATPVVERQTPQSAAAILVDLSDTVTPLAHRMLYATRENATHENLRPIIGGISTAVTGAVSNMNRLPGQPSSVIMASPDGATTWGASDIASLLSVTVCLVFQAANAVLYVVDDAIHSIIYDLLATLGQVVFSLLFIVVPLVSGLLIPLLSLLAPVLFIVSNLGLGGLLDQLHGGVL